MRLTVCNQNDYKNIVRDCYRDCDLHRCYRPVMHPVSSHQSLTVVIAVNLDPLLVDPIFRDDRTSSGCVHWQANNTTTPLQSTSSDEEKPTTCPAAMRCVESSTTAQLSCQLRQSCENGARWNCRPHVKPVRCTTWSSDESLACMHKKNSLYPRH